MEPCPPETADQLREALGNLVTRIYVESMIPSGTLTRWRKELDAASTALVAAKWYAPENN